MALRLGGVEPADDTERGVGDHPALDLGCGLLGEVGVALDLVHEAGILVPARIDPSSGYRTYAAVPLLRQGEPIGVLSVIVGCVVVGVLIAYAVRRLDFRGRGLLDVWSGDDPMTLPLLAAGAVGVIGTSTHWCGEVMSEMVTAFEKGDHDRARELNASLLDSYVYESREIAQFAQCVKTALRVMGRPALGLASWIWNTVNP